MGGRGSKITVRVRGNREEYPQVDGKFLANLEKEYAGSKHKSSGRTAGDQRNKRRHSVGGFFFGDRDGASSERETPGSSNRRSLDSKDKRSIAEALGLRSEAAETYRAETGKPRASGTGHSSQAESRTSGTGHRETAPGTTPKQTARRKSYSSTSVHPLPQGMPAAQPMNSTQGRPTPAPPTPQQVPAAPTVPSEEGAAGSTAESGASQEAVQWVIRPTPQVESVYKLGQVLGQGSFGTVRSATHLVTGAEVAVKTIRKSLLRAADVTSLRREVEILHHLSGHPRISQLLGVFEERRQLHLVLELYKGGDLFDAIIGNGRHSERTAADVMRTVLEAISYCHAMGVAHRDIKPENFMLTAEQPAPLWAKGGQSAPQLGDGKDGQAAAAASPSLGARLKLIDFGLSAFCTDDTPLTEIVGTSYYVAPEVLEGSYSLSADVWSAGVILHIMLTGYAPFDGKDDKEILRAVRKGKVNLTADAIWKTISREATDVMLAMLERDPKKRATADQVLSMPWLGRTRDACAAPNTPLPGVVSERMRRFARMNSFKKEARRVVAGLMRPEEVAGLVAQFRGLDTDRDGRLSGEELKNGIARQALLSGAGGAQLGQLNERELQELLRRSDLNGDGMLDESEFLGAALPTAAITRQALAAAAAAAASRPTSSRRSNAIAAAFAHFDADASGYITVDELQKALASHYTRGKGPDFAALLSRFDRDADGRISYHEFVEMLVQEGDDEDDASCGANICNGLDDRAAQTTAGAPTAAGAELPYRSCASLDAACNPAMAPASSSRRASIAWSAGDESCAGKAPSQGGPPASAPGAGQRPQAARGYSRSFAAMAQPPSGLVTPLDWSDECHEDSDAAFEAEPLESFTSIAGRKPAAAAAAAGARSTSPVASCPVSSGGPGSANACRMPSRFSAPQQMVPIPPQQPPQPGRPSLRSTSGSRYTAAVTAAAAAAAVAAVAAQARTSPDVESARSPAAGHLLNTQDPTSPERESRPVQGAATAPGAAAATAGRSAAALAGRAAPPPRLQLPVQPTVADMRGRRHSTTGMVLDTRVAAGGSSIMVSEPRTPLAARVSASGARGTTHPGTPDLVSGLGLGFHYNFNDLGVSPRVASPGPAGATVSLPGSPNATAAAAAAQRVLVSRASIGAQRSIPQHQPLSPSYNHSNGYHPAAPPPQQQQQLLPVLQQCGSTSPDGEQRQKVPSGSPFGLSPTPTSCSPAGSRASRPSNAGASAAFALSGPMGQRHSLHHLHPGPAHNSCGGGLVAAAAQRPATPSAPLPLLPSSVARSRRQSTGGNPAWSNPGAVPAAGGLPVSPNPLSPRVPAVMDVGSAGGAPSTGRRSRRLNALGMEDIVLGHSRNSIDLEPGIRTPGTPHDEAYMGVLPPGATGYGMPNLPYMMLAPSSGGRL